MSLDDGPGTRKSSISTNESSLSSCTSVARIGVFSDFRGDFAIDISSLFLFLPFDIGSGRDAEPSVHSSTELSSKASTVLDECIEGPSIASSPVRSTDSIFSKLTFVLGKGAGRGVGRGVRPLGSLVDTGLEGVPEEVNQ